MNFLEGGRVKVVQSFRCTKLLKSALINDYMLYTFQIHE